MGLLLRWDRAERLVPCQIQGPLGERLLAPVPRSERLESWHLVDDRGCVYSGGGAFAPLFEVLPGGELLAKLADRLPALAENGYGWVAQHRSLLSRGVPARAKSRADRTIERRERASARRAVPEVTRRC